MDEQKKIGKLISWVIILISLTIGIILFAKYNFNSYIKAEYISGISKFSRDNSIKYSKTDSYKIESTKYNDAMFYKSVKVTPNTPYKVTCMIKTQDVQKETNQIDAGANICIVDTVEKSDNVEGTTDWTKIQFLFNSYNRTEVDLGFRLGSYEGNCSGTAWFSDFKIEQGVSNEENSWNFLALMYDNVDVNIEESKQKVKLELSNTDKEDIRLCLQRFKNSLTEMSEQKINVNYELIEMTKPITTMSYDKDNGYFVSPNDIKETIDTYTKTGKYDHVYVIFKTDNIKAKENVQIADWIGLGGMEYRNIGYSNIRLPNDEENLIYKYNYRYNLFPEEVFIHEFLHTLERNAQKYGYERPALHDYTNYGYKEEALIGQKKWYQDYMNQNITAGNQKIGLPKEIFTKQPVNQSEFEYTMTLKELEEPTNIIEVINIIINKLFTLFENIGDSPNVNTVKM